jgi:phosphotransferase system HPr (HPr) family protein
VRLPDGVALHARPAAEFVRTAMAFASTISVGSGERLADAKSILSVLALGARGGAELTLRADGDDADAALNALGACVSGLSE